MIRKHVREQRAGGGELTCTPLGEAACDELGEFRQMVCHRLRTAFWCSLREGVSATSARRGTAGSVAFRGTSSLGCAILLSFAGRTLSSSATFLVDRPLRASSTACRIICVGRAMWSVFFIHCNYLAEPAGGTRCYEFTAFAQHSMLLPHHYQTHPSSRYAWVRICTRARSLRVPERYFRGLCICEAHKRTLACARPSCRNMHSHALADARPCLDT